MASKLQHTLFLWLEGFFPKRVVYYLLIRGIVGSVEDLYNGKTNDPNLKINKLEVQIVEGKGFKDANPSDPIPSGKSTPLLRIVDPTTQNTSWIIETAAILMYLEEIYTGFRPMRSPTPLERGKMNDMLSLLATANDDGKYYFRNAHPMVAKLSFLADEDRSIPVARYCKMMMNRTFKEAQECIEESLQSGGWLTPGLSYPGVVDATLAADLRFMELAYDVDMLQHKDLGLLREWLIHFKKSVPWWHDLEETGHFPESYTFGHDTLAA